VIKEHSKAMGGKHTPPIILIINDDIRLCRTRKMLLESCGAKVLTACGEPSEMKEKLQNSLDLVLIDSTNVGFARGEELCGLVKSEKPSRCVALLATPEMGLVENSLADHIIFRTGTRQMLVEINELIGERMDVNLWETIKANVHPRFVL
jgi:response regulator RpfG family c-di-GMP phosphodiesterase